MSNNIDGNKTGLFRRQFFKYLLSNFTLTKNNGVYIYCCFYRRYNPFWVCILQPSSEAIASSGTRFLDHTQRHATVGMTPLDE